jgi:hypothetical protein
MLIRTLLELFGLLLLLRAKTTKANPLLIEEKIGLQCPMFSPPTLLAIGCDVGSDAEILKIGFGTPYLHREYRTPISMTLAPDPSEESLGRRNRSARLEWSDAA